MVWNVSRMTSSCRKCVSTTLSMWLLLKYLILLYREQHLESNQLWKEVTAHWNRSWKLCTGVVWWVPRAEPSLKMGLSRQVVVVCVCLYSICVWTTDCVNTFVCSCICTFVHEYTMRERRLVYHCEPTTNTVHMITHTSAMFKVHLFSMCNYTSARCSCVGDHA